MAFIKTMKNILGDIIYPKTVTKAVYDEDGKRLDEIVKDIPKFELDGTTLKIITK